MILDENDFLTYQLYAASKSTRVKNGRVRGWVILTLSFLILAYSFYVGNDKALGIYFLVLSGLTSILYPFYTRWRYKNHYLKHIRDTYKNRFGGNTDLEFNDDTIVTRDKTGEMKINKSELQEINEIQDYYFIKIKSGDSLIISKAKSDDLEKIKSELKSITDKLGIRHNVELNWKWK
jgi:hypothetical protein